MKATSICFDEEPTAEFETIGALVRDPALAVAPDTPLVVVRRMLVDYRVAAVAVITPDDTLVGVVTRTDVLRTSDPDAKAGDAMSGCVFTLPAHAPIVRAAALIGYEGVGQVVVTDGDGVLLGMVSAVDIVRYLATEAANDAANDTAAVATGARMRTRSR